MNQSHQHDEQTVQPFRKRKHLKVVPRAFLGSMYAVKDSSVRHGKKILSQCCIGANIDCAVKFSKLLQKLKSSLYVFIYKLRPIHVNFLITMSTKNLDS